MYRFVENYLETLINTEMINKIVGNHYNKEERPPSKRSQNHLTYIIPRVKAISSH